MDYGIRFLSGLLITKCPPIPASLCLQLLPVICILVGDTRHSYIFVSTTCFYSQTYLSFQKTFVCDDLCSTQSYFSHLSCFCLLQFQLSFVSGTYLLSEVFTKAQGAFTWAHSWSQEEEHFSLIELLILTFLFLLFLALSRVHACDSQWRVKAQIHNENQPPSATDSQKTEAAPSCSKWPK